ncbi:MAG: CheR family methyltransferase [Spirochaetota bacterium]
MAFTYFFRDMPVLELAIRHFIPYVTGRSKIYIWDAGCAMGPEPYSLSILLAESMGNFAFRNLQIIASDIDESGDFDKIIDRGIYHEEPLSRIPPDLLAKYFSPASEKGYFKLDNSIINSVKYLRHDLLSLKPVRDDFSLIVCKNVLLHFQQNERIEVIKMFYNSLAAGGYFVTEQTQKFPDEINYLFERVAPDSHLFKKK